MFACSAAEKALRRFEATLDAHHRSLPLWSQPRQEAIFATLAAFDLMMLPLLLGLIGGGPRPQTVQKVKWLHDSLIHAMQFFWQESRELEVSPRAEQPLIEQGFELLSHCETYGILCDMHAGYGRGLYTLDVDEEQKRIRFVYAEKAGGNPDPAGILEDTPAEWGHLLRPNQNPEAMRRAVEAMRRIPHHWNDGCFALDDSAALREPTLEDAVQYVLPPHDPFLEDDDDLAGISAKNFRTFWHGLFRWSMVASWLHLDAITYGKHQQHDRLPTQIVRRQDFVERIMLASGLPQTVVEACLTRLSFGWNCPRKPDIYLQPLLCGTDYVAWSPHLVQLSKYKRNMLKLMARIPALKTAADNLIGSRERSLGPQFGRLLASHGWQFKTHMPLPDGSGEIDLLAFHNKYPSELLVVELKGVLGVDEVNEVEHATQEMITGQGQLRNSIAFLQKADLPTKTLL